MIVVDTSVWIDYFGGRDSPAAVYLDLCLATADPVPALTDIILTEILQGLSTDRAVRRVEAHLSALEVLRLLELSDFHRAASLYRRARRQGVTIRRTSDCLIASVCVREGVPILHSDADFDHLAATTPLTVVPVP